MDDCVVGGAGSAWDDTGAAASLACVVSVAHSAQSTKALKLALLSCDGSPMLTLTSFMRSGSGDAIGVSGSVEEPRSWSSRFYESSLVSYRKVKKRNYRKRAAWRQQRRVELLRNIDVQLTSPGVSRTRHALLALAC